MERIGLPNGIFIADSNALIEVTGAGKQMKLNFADFNFTVAQVRHSDVMLVTLYDGDARYRLLTDSLATSTLGHHVVSGTTIEILGTENIMNFSIAATTDYVTVFVSLMSTRGRL